MKIRIAKPEYQILEDATGRIKVQMKGTDDTDVPSRDLPRNWSDLDGNGDWGNSYSVAYFQSVAEAEAFIAKLELARVEKEKAPPPVSWKVVKKISPEG